MDEDDIVESLTSFPDEQMLDVLRQVFARRMPNPEESAYVRNKYFLGTASSLLKEDVGEETPTSEQHWGDWGIEAVGYIDRDYYSDGLGPDYGFCQSGTCLDCKTAVRSNVKHALCPICGSKVYCT